MNNQCSQCPVTLTKGEVEYNEKWLKRLGLSLLCRSCNQDRIRKQQEKLKGDGEKINNSNNHHE